MYKYRRKSNVDIINEEMKGIISEVEETGIHKCSRRSRVDIINKEVKGWTYSSKQQEALPEPTKTKEEIRLECMKIKVKGVVLEWDGFVFQDQLKYLMYVDRSLCDHTKKDKWIDELNFKNTCV